ncbi:alpha/beta fold hydrolase [Dyadobacter pollutisoli]|uniref:Alpha/beta hydrolase n=1 Tax=Dyadobacter pollutisoli TaxID=2910158 RepID=A0A9E8SPG3_9BACT|nr:alpha/beta hydrolase [Dyadobacter pollutisoli]WAC15329.1 alpha/beta hydrolase [Dyadobacter pollutisoli]
MLVFSLFVHVSAAQILPDTAKLDRNEKAAHYAQLRGLDHLKIDSSYVVGWSDGGINGLLLAMRHPKK